MKRLFPKLATLGGFVLLSMLVFTGCVAFAPRELTDAVAALSGGERLTLGESVRLFLETGYGEFCALLACAFAAHLVLLIRQYILPFVQTHAPRLCTCIGHVIRRAATYLYGRLGDGGRRLVALVRRILIVVKERGWKPVARWILRAFAKNAMQNDTFSDDMSSGDASNGTEQRV